MNDDILRGEPSKLATLFSHDEGWKPEELEAILKHQLSAPLVYDLSSLMTSDSDCFAADMKAADGLGTFRDLLVHPSPPVPLLRLTKEFAKCSDQRKDSPIPSEIAIVLYYAAVVAAQLKHHERISSLTDHEVTEGIQWAMEQSWLDAGIRSLFLEALSKSEASPSR